MTDAKIILLIRLHAALLPTAAARQIFDCDCYAVGAVLSHNIFWSVPVTEHNKFGLQSSACTTQSVLAQWLGTLRPWILGVSHPCGECPIP